MDIVVDTSVIIAVLVNEPHKSTLAGLTKGAELVAPASVHWEIGNAFSAMLGRKRIDLAQALKAIEAYHRIPIRRIDVEIEDTLAIAAQHAVDTCDAYLIRCALKFNAPILSLDKGLLQAAQVAEARVIEVR